MWGKCFSSIQGFWQKLTLFTIFFYYDMTPPFLWAYLNTMKLISLAGNDGHTNSSSFSNPMLSYSLWASVCTIEVKSTTLFTLCLATNSKAVLQRAFARPRPRNSFFTEILFSSQAPGSSTQGKMPTVPTIDPFSSATQKQLLLPGCM